MLFGEGEGIAVWALNKADMGERECTKSNGLAATATKASPG